MLSGIWSWSDQGRVILAPSLGALVRPKKQVAGGMGFRSVGLRMKSALQGKLVVISRN